MGNNNGYDGDGDEGALFSYMVIEHNCIERTILRSNVACVFYAVCFLIMMFVVVTVVAMIAVMMKQRRAIVTLFVVVRKMIENYY